MLNSLVPNEKKQLNKSHISLAVPLTDAIQEVGPISSQKATLCSLCHVLYKAVLLRERATLSFPNILH